MVLDSGISRAPRAKADKAGRTNRAAYLFLAPWLAGMALITIGPMVVSLLFSFTNYNMLREPSFVGLNNWFRLASDFRLHNALAVTFQYVFISVPLQLALALALALALNRGVRGLDFYRSIFYLPSLLGSSVAIAILWRQIFGADGLLNALLLPFGIVGPSWIADPNTSLWTLITLNVWTFGSPMVIFLAGLRQIPGMYYEAAEIDGANRWQKFLYVTLPMLTPLVFFNFVLQLIGSFQAFTHAYVISNGTGGPIDSTLFYTLYLYDQAFKNFNMGYASAMAWLLLVIIGVMTAISFATSKYWVRYDD